MTALSADAQVPIAASQYMRQYPVVAADVCYKGGFAGIDPAGYVKPFEPGDLFVGIFNGTVDNSAGTAGAKTADVITGGDFEFTLTGATLDDIGKPVFATDDATLAFSGHPDAFVGKVINYMTTNTALIRLRQFGEQAGSGCIELVADGSKLMLFPNVLTAVGETLIDGKWRGDAIGAGIAGATQGLGVNNAAGAVYALLDNDNEAQNVTIESPQVFNITKGITLEIEATLETAGGAATDDLDFGLMGLSGGVTDTERADMNAATAGLLSALFHVDTNGLDLKFSSDDNSSPIAAADTEVNVVLQTYNTFKIVVRPAGTVAVWVDAVRKLSTTAFSVGASGLLAAIFNLEKSTGTGVPEARFKRLRVAGAIA
jgi:hypothetical protein